MVRSALSIKSEVTWHATKVLNGGAWGVAGVQDYWDAVLRDGVLLLI